MIFNVPADILNIDFQLAAIEVNIKNYQNDYFNDHGYYIPIEDLSTMFPFPVGVGRLHECTNSGAGYRIYLTATSSVLTNIAGTEAIYDENELLLGYSPVDFDTYDWYKVVNYIDPSEGFDWRPIGNFEDPE